jgi:hypothetical protein
MIQNSLWNLFDSRTSAQECVKVIRRNKLESVFRKNRRGIQGSLAFTCCEPPRREFSNRQRRQESCSCLNAESVPNALWVMITVKTLLRQTDHEDVIPVSASAKARETHLNSFCYMLPSPFTSHSYSIQIEIPCEPLRVAIKRWPLKYMRQCWRLSESDNGNGEVGKRHIHLGKEYFSEKKNAAKLPCNTVQRETTHVFIIHTNTYEKRFSFLLSNKIKQSRGTKWWTTSKKCEISHFLFFSVTSSNTPELQNDEPLGRSVRFHVLFSSQ